MDKQIKQEIDSVADVFADNYSRQGLFEFEDGNKLPKRSEIIELLNEIRRLMFPGYFGTENTSYVSLKNFAGNTLAVVYEKLSQQMTMAFQYGHANNEKSDGKNYKEKAKEATATFIKRLPYIQEMLIKDVEAEFSGDPAANSREEIIFSYPGLFAVFVYRIAHELYELKVPFIPRIMSEHAHSRTGIDINPGATIGEYFFIDHGTGIVIGETTIIGNYVKIYQGVTLGALSTKLGQALSGVKRHPTIEDNVVIYANTTILGGETVIGKNSVIAGNSFIIESVPENTKVSSKLPEVKIREREDVK